MPKMKKPVQERSRQRREKILLTTKKILREQDLESFTTTALAAQACIPVGSIYQYFPNKETILLAILEEYLAAIRQLYVDLQRPEFLSLPRRTQLQQLVTSIMDLESRDQIDDALNKAIILIPALREADQRHREQTAGMMADLLKAMGSPWTKARLRRFSKFLYFMNAGIWSYRAELRGHSKERQQWEFSVFYATLALCFDDDDA